VIVASVWNSSLISHALLGLQRLVQALGVAATRQRAAGELVDDDDLAVAGDHVVLVALEQLLGADGVVQVADQRRVGRLVEVLDAERSSTSAMPGSRTETVFFFSSTS
jgi:hypothetical protein